LSQRIFRRMKLNVLVGAVVTRFDCRRPGVVVVELPRRELAISAGAAAHFNYTRRTEVRPGEFFFARPHQLYWFACGFSEARRFDGAFAGMFDAIRRAGIRNDDAHVLRRKMKGAGKFIDNTDWTLRAGTQGQLDDWRPVSQG